MAAPQKTLTREAASSGSIKNKMLKYSIKINLENLRNLETPVLQWGTTYFNRNFLCICAKVKEKQPSLFKDCDNLTISVEKKQKGDNDNYSSEMILRTYCGSSKSIDSNDKE